MTILRSGATKKYSDNWAKAFGKSKKASGSSGSHGKSKKATTGQKKSVTVKGSKT